MNRIIGVMTIVLLIVYTGTAVWMISKQRTVGAAVGVAVGFLCGGFVIVPVAAAVATFVCWAAVIMFVLAIVGALFG